MLWKVANDPAEGQIVRMIAMPNQKKKKNGLSIKSVDWFATFDANSIIWITSTWWLFCGSVDKWNYELWETFPTTWRSRDFSWKHGVTGICENEAPPLFAKTEGPQNTRPICSKTLRGKNKCMNFKNLCHKYCCVYDTDCSFEPVTCKQCFQNKQMRNFSVLFQEQSPVEPYREMILWQLMHGWSTDR